MLLNIWSLKVFRVIDSQNTHNYIDWFLFQFISKSKFVSAGYIDKRWVKNYVIWVHCLNTSCFRFESYCHVSYRISLYENLLWREKPWCNMALLKCNNYFAWQIFSLAVNDCNILEAIHRGRPIFLNQNPQVHTLLYDNDISCKIRHLYAGISPKLPYIMLYTSPHTTSSILLVYRRRSINDHRQWLDKAIE